MSFHSVNFPPAARLDEYIAIVYAPNDVKYGKVTWLEQIPVYAVAFLLGPGESKTDQELTYVEVGENEVMQLRFSLRGPAEVKIKLPRTTSKFSLRRDTAFVTEDIARYPEFPVQTELHLLEDSHIFMDVVSRNTNHYDRLKVYFTGWRLVFEEVRERPKAYTAMIIQGFAPRTRV